MNLLEVPDMVKVLELAGIDIKEFIFLTEKMYIQGILMKRILQLITKVQYLSI